MSISPTVLNNLFKISQDLLGFSQNTEGSNTVEKITGLNGKLDEVINLAGIAYKVTGNKQQHEALFLEILKNVFNARSDLDLAEKALLPDYEWNSLQGAQMLCKSKLKILDEKLKIGRKFGVPLARPNDIAREIQGIMNYLTSNATPFERDFIYDGFQEMTFEFEDIPTDDRLICSFNAEFTPLSMTAVRTFIHEMGRKFIPSAQTKEDPSLMLFPRDTRPAEVQNKHAQDVKVTLPNLSEMRFKIGSDESVVSHRIFFHMYFIQSRDSEFCKTIDPSDPDWGKTAFLDKTKSTPQQRFKAVQRVRAEWLLSTIKQGIISDADRPYLKTEKPEICEKKFDPTPFTLRESYPVIDNPFLYFFPPVDTKVHPGEVEFEPSETGYLNGVVVPNFTDKDGKTHSRMAGFEAPKRPLKLNKLFPLLYVKLHQVCSRNASSDQTLQTALDTHHEVKRTGPILDIYAGFGRAALLHEVNVDKKYKLEAIDELEKELKAHWKV